MSERAALTLGAVRRRRRVQRRRGRRRGRKEEREPGVVRRMLNGGLVYFIFYGVLIGEGWLGICGVESSRVYNIMI